MASFFNASITDIRDFLKNTFTHLGVSTDNTAFAGNQSAIDPSGTGTNLIKAISASSNIGSDAFEHEIQLDGATEFTGNEINTISGMIGATRTDAYTRDLSSNSTPAVDADIDYFIRFRTLITDID